LEKREKGGRVPERLTECLIRKGVLTPDQASEAMERQVLQGGAIDTSLLELELVSERDLVEAMSAAYGLEGAGPERASADLDARALRAFPEQWAKKHLLAPLAIEAGGLSLLTPAPADLNLIARLGELLELEIKPLLAPEFRVSQRIALLYETEPPDRLATLIAKHAQVRFAQKPLPARSESTVARAAQPLPFGDAVNALREAKHRDEIAETALRYAINDLQLAALFIVHSDHVEGWMGLGPGSEKVPKLPIPLKADSAFRVVLDTQAHYLGPLPSDPLHLDFLERLGRPAPRAVLIVPIRIKSRTVALLYGENGSGTIIPRLAADLMLFTTHVQGALESLLMRKKAETISDLSSRPAPAPPEERPPAQLARLAQQEEEERELTPVPPMHELRGTDSTEYAYVRKKEDGEEDEAESTIDALVALDSKIPESTDSMAASFAPQVGAAEEPSDSGEEDGWDEVSVPPAPLETDPFPEPVPEPSAPDTIADEPVLAFTEPLVAEHADGGALLDELRELEALPVPMPDEGWDDVQVQPWDEFGGARDPNEAEKWIERGHRELIAMRESLGEDVTVPDLSPEAWIRASSDIVRPRPIPPEVRERAAQPSSDAPLIFRGAVLDAEDFEPEPISLSEPLEPVPLVQRATASVAARSIDPNIMRTTGEIALHHPRAVDTQGNVVTRAELDPDIEEGPPQSELDALVEEVQSVNREERLAAKEALRAMGPEVLPRIAEIFPGVLEIDPFSSGAPLPPFAECGVLPELVAHFGAEAHPHMVRRLDAPEPVRRFFAVYYYTAAFVPEAIPKLIQRLHDEETRVSLLAARTLFSYREHPEFGRVLDHLHGRLEASSMTARRHATYLIGLFRDVTAIPKLIDVFDRKEKAMYEIAEDALAEITKQRFGANPKKWRAWWTKNQDKSRIAWLIDGLMAKESSLRRSAAEELRAVTGLDMGYDDDAPKRQREESRQRWIEWWSKQGSSQAEA
jgi:hypothetical protein